MAAIGKPKRTIEVVPLEQPVPQEAPSPVEAPDKIPAKT
jgi:hypothetical protein